MDSALKPGGHLGRYRLVRELGRGSMGLVFLAEDTLLHQSLCVKVLHPAMAGLPEAIERFHREILLSRRIAHKGVCRLYDLHKEGEIRFITMEHVEGAPLADVLKGHAQLPIAQVITIGRSICAALAAAHDVGVIHRDLKPGNIILRADHEVTLLDFGIATAADLGSSLTMPGVPLGTRSYIAPEVWAGHAATAKSDQFAVGVILYKCITGQLPFPQKDAVLLDAMRATVPIAPHITRADVPPALEALVLRALALEPERRFDDARAIGRALEMAEARGGAFADDTTNVTLTTPSIPEQPPISASADRMHWSDPTQPEQRNPNDITSESGAWMVDGRRAGAPLVVKELAPTIERAPVVLPRALPWGRVAAALAVAGVAAVAVLAINTRGADVDPARERTALPAARAVVPVVEPALVAAEPAPAAPVVRDATGLPEVQVREVPEVPEVRERDVPAPKTDARPSARRPRAPPNEDAIAYTAALVALGKDMAERGLRTGDDVELDRERALAEERARTKAFREASVAVAAARTRARAVVIDRAFVDRKLRRFNDAFDRVVDPALRAELDDSVGRALTEMAAGRYANANNALNKANAAMNERHR